MADTTRRTFVKLSTAAAWVGASEAARAASGRGVAVHVDSASPISSAMPIAWAAGKLREALVERGVYADNPHAATFESAGSGAALVIVVAPQDSVAAAPFGAMPQLGNRDTVALLPGRFNEVPAILVTGADSRGMVYGLLELAERVGQNDDAMLALHLPGPVVETTPNRVRSCARAFLSEIEDKAWFYDRGFWARYLDTLASSRFNRFNFALGFGWDFPRGVTGDYLHFPYPYLVSVSGYEGVRVDPPLADGERERNLETLKFLAAETARRGMEFQLGLWTHAYAWTDSPHSDHRIVGLTPETHAAYCRDALAMVLRECPQITGLTLRIHGESGIPEGSYDFWSTLFEAISGAKNDEGSKRTLEIEMHAKGLGHVMIDMARKTGNPVKAGAKFWAEHQGLGYHQADIRAAEIPKPGHTDSGVFSLSGGSRSFTRYGYGDFYQQGIGLELLYRVWPGTQRHLLWADPALASGYGRAAHFCGAAGMELCEPLTFKGREGSGHPGGRLAYTDVGLGSPAAGTGLADLDTAKFGLTYRMWGRHLYSPDAGAEVYRPALRSQFGAAAVGMEQALTESSRILPLVTTAWLPSASNHEFWPEMLTPVPILPVQGKPLYSDSPAPHNVSAISPLDPQLFTTIGQHAANLLSGAPDPRYHSGEVIAWLEAMVSRSTAALTAATAAAGGRASQPEFRRAAEDLLILNGVGGYYANLFRAALYFSIHEQTEDATAAARSLAAYGAARDLWARMAARAQTIYAADVSYGSTAFRRGHWADRLPAIDRDLGQLRDYYRNNETQRSSTTDHAVRLAMDRVAMPVRRPEPNVTHVAPTVFTPGAELRVTVTAPASKKAVLWYRHVTQAERWASMAMEHGNGRYAAAIPSEYTAFPYPLQYYFELHTATAATLYPRFNATLSNEPYFAVYKRA